MFLTSGREDEDNIHDTTQCELWYLSHCIVTYLENDKENKWGKTECKYFNVITRL